MNEQLIAILVVLLAFVYIGWSYRTDNKSEFHTADRKVGLIRSIATLFTVVGAPHFAIFTSLTFIIGWYAVGFYLGAFSGLFILAIYSGKIRTYIDDDAHSFNDIADKEIGPSSSIILTSVGILYVVGVIVAQLILGAQLLSEFANTTYEFSVVLIMITIMGYLIWGGYNALVNTDVIQGGIMLIFTLTLAGFAYYNIPLLDDSSFLSEADSVFSVPLVPLLFIAGILAVTGSPEIWQRILTAKDDDTAYSSLVGAGSTMLFWGALVVGIGAAIYLAIPDVDPNIAFVEFINTSLPSGMLGLVSVLIIVAILSTADTEIFTATILARKEIGRRLNFGKELDIKNSRILIIVFSIISGIGALLLTDLMVVWGILMNLVYISAPLAFSIILSRGGKTKQIKKVIFIISFALSVIAFICVSIFINDFFSWWALSIIGFASIPLFFPGK